MTEFTYAIRDLLGHRSLLTDLIRASLSRPRPFGARRSAPVQAAYKPSPFFWALPPTARALLRVAESHPQAVLEALHR